MNNTKGLRGLRERALRAAYGGLLLSPLSEFELKTLANELDSQFIGELRNMLLGLPGQEQAELYSGDGIEEKYGYERDMAKLIYERSKSRRLSKDKVYGYMREVDFDIARKITRQALTLGECLKEFVLAAGSDSANRLLLKVSGTPEQDPYLVGITDRK